MMCPCWFSSWLPVSPAALFQHSSLASVPRHRVARILPSAAGHVKNRAPVTSRPLPRPQPQPYPVLGGSPMSAAAQPPRPLRSSRSNSVPASCRACPEPSRRGRGPFARTIKEKGPCRLPTLAIFSRQSNRPPSLCASASPRAPIPNYSLSTINHQLPTSSPALVHNDW